MLRHCPDAIWMVREDRVCFANPAALRLFHAPDEAALIGMHWQRLVSPGDWLSADAHCGRPANGDSGRMPRLELDCLALDGAAIVVESAACQVSLDGCATMMLVQRDIGERRRAERERREQQGQLEKRMLERSDELRQALAEARLADQAKDAFLANVSHELRTPLSGLLGLLDLAQTRCTDAALLPYLEKMGRAGKHLSRIINDLLDLSKIVAGRMDFEAIPFSLREMLRHAHEVMAQRAEAKGLELRVRADNGIPDRLLGDPLRIEQVLLNLIGNAIKFTDRGGVTLQVAATICDADAVQLVFEVEDSGIGMSAEEIAALFQPFAQATAATSRLYGGTGLGLALSQRLAESMGGRITVSSRKGEGSRFRLGLRLPLAHTAQPAAAPASPAASPAATADHASVHVLLVEDDPLNVEIVTELLQAVGIYPQLACNGHEAIALLSREGPTAFDLVLMDIQMPVLDGLAATRLIRSWPGFATLPIIALSAHTLEHEKQIGLAAGMNGHIDKPFDPTDLYAMLDTWLPQGRSAPEAAAATVTDAPVQARPTLHALRCLDAATALVRFGGDEERYRHWLAKFVDECPAVAPEIRRALAAGDSAKAAAAAHSFKGSVGTLGLDTLRQRAAQLEAAIRAGLGAVPELRLLERAIDEARRELVAALGR